MQTPRSPWLVTGTLVGVMLGLLLSPAGAGNMRLAERVAWQEMYWVLGCAAGGMVVGLFLDWYRVR